MRLIHTLPLAAAILLAGCGGDADTNEDGAISDEEVTAEAADLVQPRPGQYSTKLELIEFDAPGLPDGAKQQMQQVFASGLAEGNTFCMTPADVANNGPEQMVKNLAEADCTMNSFNVSGNTIAANMQCPSEAGGSRKVTMNGQMTAESSTMTMEMQQEIPSMGATTMKVKVTSQRVGDCSA
ncbi:MAG TPA: DUF3617 domain-containing protein [Croceibacterium sp.]